jgi:hypothetical protein
VSAPRDAVALDTRVRYKLGVRAGQSIQDRCRELVAPGSGATCGQEQAARILLDETRAPWVAMVQADAVPCVQRVR